MESTFYNCLDFGEVYGRTPYFYITGGDPILHCQVESKTHHVHR